MSSAVTRGLRAQKTASLGILLVGSFRISASNLCSMYQQPLSPLESLYWLTWHPFLRLKLFGWAISLDWLYHLAISKCNAVFSFSIYKNVNFIYGGVKILISNFMFLSWVFYFNFFFLQWVSLTYDFWKFSVHSQDCSGRNQEIEGKRKPLTWAFSFSWEAFTSARSFSMHWKEKG